MKKNMCRGCFYITTIEQIIFWNEDGVKKLDSPIKKQKEYCKNYQLHLDWVDRIVEGEESCKRYWEGL